MSLTTITKSPSIAPTLLATPSPIDLPQPLERVQVTDGLLITATHWQRAHQYHRHYQRLHYQALHQSGIVQGLGVCVIGAPDEIASEYRDHRWIQIQPGFAIDAWGNAIVVPEAMSFRIASEAPNGGTAVVSIVLRHVDPDQLQVNANAPSAFIRETFRIDETVNDVDANDIVLCRVTIGSNKVTIQPSHNVFAPGSQELDFRDRRFVGNRPQKDVKVETWVYPPTLQSNPWQDLIQASSCLYPTLTGTVRSQAEDITEASFRSDILHFALSQLVSLSEASLQALKTSLESGTVLLIEAPTEGSVIAQLATMQYELQRSIAQLKHQPNAQSICRDLTTEWTATTQDLDQYLYLIHETIQTVLNTADIEFKLPSKDEVISQGITGRLNQSHPLRHEPFLFDQLPIVNGHPLHLFNWGGIVLAVGHLSQSWSLGEEGDFATRSREQIRTCQELGINLLRFATTHRHRTQLQTNPAQLNSD